MNSQLKKKKYTPYKRFRGFPGIVMEKTTFKEFEEICIYIE